MSSESASVLQRASAVDSAWSLLRAARALGRRAREKRAIRAVRRRRTRWFAAVDARQLRVECLRGIQANGWESRLPADDPRSDMLNLYLPICSATSARPLTVGHLGQSLDGFIATPSGDSQTVTGGDNIVHLHRLRALCDAVVVGAGTVAADDPQLTTRHVPGPHPLRVVFDPATAVDADISTVHGSHRSRAVHLRRDPGFQPGESHVGSAVIAAIEGGEPGEEVGAGVASSACARMRASVCRRRRRYGIAIPRSQSSRSACRLPSRRY